MFRTLDNLFDRARAARGRSGAGEGRPQGGVTRRRFVQGTVAAAGAGMAAIALSSCSSGGDSQQEDGAAGRRTENLEALRAAAPDRVKIRSIDITAPEAEELLLRLIADLGGCDLLLHCAGIGYNNPQLDAAREIATAETNTVGFTRIMDTAFDYFRKQGGGHLAAISSIAGTKGLGAAAAYSASKRYQNTYLDALAQLSRMQRLDIRITDIRPGFVDTPLLREGKYPMLMRPEKVATRIVRALEQRKRRIVIDRRYAVLVFFWRLIPEWLWERLPIRTK